MDDGVLKESVGGQNAADATYGDGVYLTKIDGEEPTKDEQADKLYDGVSEKALNEGKLECYIEVDVPQDSPYSGQITQPDPHRPEVYLLPGKNLNFKGW